MMCCPAPGIAWKEAEQSGAGAVVEAYQPAQMPAPPAAAGVAEAALVEVVLLDDSATPCARTLAPHLSNRPCCSAEEGVERLSGLPTMAAPHPIVVDHFEASPDVHAHIHVHAPWLPRAASRGL